MRHRISIRAAAIVAAAVLAATAFGGVNSVNINHVILSGSPNGTIYRVCANDAPQAPPTPTVIPTLTEWGLYALALLLLLAGVFALRRKFR